MSSLQRIVYFCALASMVACTHPTKLSAPEEFAELGHSGPYTYRAMTARGVVVGVRAEKNAPQASLQFWTEAIDLKLRKQGYEASSAHDVKSVEGVPGKQLRYVRNEDRRPYRYWLTVYVTGDQVFLVEATGDKEAFDPAEDSVQRTVLSLRGAKG